MASKQRPRTRKSTTTTTNSKVVLLPLLIVLVALWSAVPPAFRSFFPTTTTTTTTMSDAFFKTIEGRRTIYALSATSTIPDAKVVDIVQKAVKHVPSTFNSQTTRAVVLLKDEHTKLWDIVIDVMKKIVPEKDFPTTETRLKGFRGGYGSVLFFEDQDAVKGMQDKFAIYQDRFPPWSEQTSGMHQFVVWTALEAEGLGANLQHYNPLIDQRVAAEWKVPANWKLISQLVFGGIVKPAGEKTFQPLEERVKVYGA